jgi:hypothetical protein
MYVNYSNFSFFNIVESFVGVSIASSLVKNLSILLKSICDSILGTNIG